jgi:Zn-dependent peptidase ImmA (M78 family)
MLGPATPAATMRSVLQRVRQIPRLDLPGLDGVAGLAQEVVGRMADSPPFEQGYELAGWLRSSITSDGQSANDPEVMLRNWGIRLARLPRLDPRIDAVCCWGPRHGPAILGNPAGRHMRTRGATRATLAHEIGHLLLDRAGALPLGEVLGGRTPQRAEARASAFAAELLLPRAVAREEFRAAPGAEAAVRRMTGRYKVSRELVAWQIKNSGEVLTRDEHAYLRKLVSEPARF